jgi:hypothetical protein
LLHYIFPIQLDWLANYIIQVAMKVDLSSEFFFMLNELGVELKLSMNVCR